MAGFTVVVPVWWPHSLDVCVCACALHLVCACGPPHWVWVRGGGATSLAGAARDQRCACERQGGEDAGVGCDAGGAALQAPGGGGGRAEGGRAGA
eukprot:3555350-Prymnesium_polylepis.1